MILLLRFNLLQVQDAVNVLNNKKASSPQQILHKAEKRAFIAATAAGTGYLFAGSYGSPSAPGADERPTAPASTSSVNR